MNQAKCDEMDYINFLIAAQQVFGSGEALQTHPAEDQAIFEKSVSTMPSSFSPSSLLPAGGC